MTTKINFYRVGDPYGCFSNFSPHAIFLDYRTWQTSEHYFQAQKFESWKDRWEIQLAKSPMEAARMGRSRSRPLRKDWERVKDDIMRKAIRAKILQHHDVRETLFSTEGCEIVEHTKNDSYWGDGGDGKGKNMLGSILMEVRDELLRDGGYNELERANELVPPWLKYPEIQIYSIGWRMGRGEFYLMEWSPWYRGLSTKGKLKYQEIYPVPEEWSDFISMR